MAGVMLIFASIAHAEHYYLDGFKLMQTCQRGDTGERSPTFEENVRADIAAGVCIGYIMGGVDGIHTAETLSRSSIICEPDVRAGQIKMIVRRFLETHPEYLHRSAADIVAVALREAFPCTKRR